MEIGLQVKAEGDPIDILRWLHDIEHLRFVSHFANWRLRTETVADPSSFIAPPSPDQASEDVRPSAVLDGQIILTVRNNGS